MKDGKQIIVASDAGISIQSVGDISDALAACFGAAGLLLMETDLATEFFNLRSGLAGELFQKFVNYSVRAAIVLPAPEIYGERFSELAYEHSTHPMIRFVRSKDEAIAWLSS
jgi:hypothetical protein